MAEDETCTYGLYAVDVVVESTLHSSCAHTAQRDDILTLMAAETGDDPVPLIVDEDSKGNGEEERANGQEDGPGDGVHHCGVGGRKMSADDEGSTKYLKELQSHFQCAGTLKVSRAKLVKSMAV